MIKPFWRDESLSGDEQRLVGALYAAHREATFRQNASSQIINVSFHANNGDFLKAVSAGLGSLGGSHAPIVQAYSFLKNTSLMNGLILDVYHLKPFERFPGWGNSFVKGQSDPIVDKVIELIFEMDETLKRNINAVTTFLNWRGKEVFPNLACATASTAIILGMPKELSPALLLHARCMAWAELIYDSTRTTPVTILRDHSK